MILVGSASTVLGAPTHITMGNEAKVIADGDTSQTYIAIGDHAHTFIGRGGQEGAISPTNNRADAAGAIAIGDYTYARSGSIMIGSHNFKGKMGDVENIDSSLLETEGDSGVYGFTVATTTIGTNSFTKGFLASTFGSYNIQSSKNVGYGWLNNRNVENLGATVVGTLNSNESFSTPEPSGLFAKSYSGIANSIVGVANRVNNANGALVYGAGNEITNSVQTISGVYDTMKLDDVAEVSQTLRDAVKSSNGGGATMAFGGGNVADYTSLTMMTGVNNTVTGTADSISTLDAVIGYNNTLTNVSNTKVIGSNNTINDNAQSNTVFGDNYTIASGKSNNVILGNADESYIWRPALGAVSVGESGSHTRRITNVAAGINDTDAVNVAQLKQVAAGSGGSVDLIAGDGITLTKAGDGSWTISTNFQHSGSDKVTYTDENARRVNNRMELVDETDSGSTTSSGRAASIETILNADDGNETSVGDDGKIGVKGDGTNISTSIVGGDVQVTLSKDLAVNSVTINNGPTINNTGIDMNGTKITNVQNGDVIEGSKDAVNGGQLWDVKQGLNGRINSLDTKINRVGANAAAMANLHPLDFDPDDKWSFSAGYGNYRSANAFAVGTFYRPNENSMVNISGSFGNGETMIGVGASFKFGNGAPVNKRQLQKTVIELQNTVANQQALIDEQNKKIEKLEAMVTQLLAK
ncbi:MAG: YadA-like family protein [Veillonella sp.]|nr:YadA-like family protein [Veillonella sp.]